MIISAMQMSASISSSTHKCEGGLDARAYASGHAFVTSPQFGAIQQYLWLFDREDNLSSARPHAEPLGHLPAN